MSQKQPTTASTSCADDYDPNSLNMDEAVTRIHSMLHPVNAYEQLDIRQALNRVLFENVSSTINVPSHTNSAMDGYAIKYADKDKTLSVIGNSFAGHPYDGVLESGQAIRIMTGAAIPDGADTVVMQEHVKTHETAIEITHSIKSGENIRQKGEDLKIGDTALSKGRKIIASDVGLLASMGISEVKVSRKLRVAFFSTGDELKNVGEPLEYGQIYDSNRYTLYCMLNQLGCDVIDMGIIPDNKEKIESAFKIAAHNADVLITSGGVSVGEADFVKLTLEKLGKINFWKIAMKPGRPLAVGTIDKSYFFGLPGNPVSAMVTFFQFVQPALRFLMGQSQYENSYQEVKCVSPLKKRPGRVEFQRGILFKDENGKTVVKTTGNQGSHVLSSMSKANCFIILEQDCGQVDVGTTVKVQAFETLM